MYYCQHSWEDEICNFENFTVRNIAETKKSSENQEEEEEKKFIRIAEITARYFMSFEIFSFQCKKVPKWKVAERFCTRGQIFYDFKRHAFIWIYTPVNSNMKERDDQTMGAEVYAFIHIWDYIFPKFSPSHIITWGSGIIIGFQATCLFWLPSSEHL